MSKKIIGKKQPASKPVAPEENICFVISPIGKEGTKVHSDFKEVLDYIIKPAFEESGFNHKVIRADEIDRSGSFIKDILENIYSSNIVIADLTGQNPNVFYELGVRHSLRPRTILIAQNIDDIPSDLREYRTIIFDTTAKGASAFKKRIKEFLKEIDKDPERYDNPVLDRLGNIIENKLARVEYERNSLKAELSKLLSGRASQAEKQPQKDVRKRFERILRLKNAEKKYDFDSNFVREKESFSLPARQGGLNLYFLNKGESIIGFWYVSINDAYINIDEELSDIRILLENCSKGQNVKIEFILVFGSELADKKEYMRKFNKMKTYIPEDQRKYFDLHLLDPSELESWEKELGLKI